MIPKYRDHAANERTYLAWIRTGITVMMLGFLVEKFELFLSVLAHQLGVGHVPEQAFRGSAYVGVTLVTLSIVLISAATWRFFRTKRELEGETTRAFRGTASVLALAGVVVAFGIYLLGYLARLI